MSASSIAQVCGISKQRTLEILKDIFLKIIELAKAGEQMSLDVKIGNIIIGKENRLVFVNKTSQDQIKTLTSDRLR